MKITTPDDLVQMASEHIQEHFVQGRHQIAAAILDAEGQVHRGVHLEAMVGRASICAEAVALGAAVQRTRARLTMIAAVRHPLRGEVHAHPFLVAPCGLCRELLLDYGPQMKVVLPGHSPQVPNIVDLASLLPIKYVGTKWSHNELLAENHGQAK